MSIPLWLQCTIFWCTSSRIMNHVTKIKSSQTGFLNMTMSSLYSNGLHSHQISINRAALGCGGTGDSHHGCTADKSAATVWCYKVNMTNISEECFQHLVESMPRRIKAVLKAKGVQPDTSKVFLIKWPVYIYAMKMNSCIWRGNWNKLSKNEICWKCTQASGHWLYRWVCFFIRTDLEKLSITCSAKDSLQWMGAVRMRVQTADKNITIIHTILQSIS